jgi:hypothetical protein
MSTYSGKYSEDKPNFERKASFLKVPKGGGGRAAVGEGENSPEKTYDYSGGRSAANPAKSHFGTEFQGGRPYENTGKIPEDEQG